MKNTPVVQCPQCGRKFANRVSVPYHTAGDPNNRLLHSDTCRGSYSVFERGTITLESTSLIVRKSVEPIAPLPLIITLVAVYLELSQYAAAIHLATDELIETSKDLFERKQSCY